jgi:hypothetical protein
VSTLKIIFKILLPFLLLMIISCVQPQSDQEEWKPEDESKNAVLDEKPTPAEAAKDYLKQALPLYREFKNNYRIFPLEEPKTYSIGADIAFVNGPAKNYFQKAINYCSTSSIPAIEDFLAKSQEIIPKSAETEAIHLFHCGKAREYLETMKKLCSFTFRNCSGTTDKEWRAWFDWWVDFRVTVNASIKRSAGSILGENENGYKYPEVLEQLRLKYNIMLSEI